MKHLLEKRVPRLPLRMMLGGTAIVLMWRLLGSSDYLGLGVPSIVRAFVDPSPPPYAFAAKLVFTSVTLAAGFLGGEVTPLFFIGSTLGAAFWGVSMGIPVRAGCGRGARRSLPAAAANTPLALSIMAVELLGANVLPHVVIVCVTAYLITGHRGIYPAQRLTRFKTGHRSLLRAVPLREAHAVTNPDDHRGTDPPPTPRPSPGDTP